MQKAADEHLNEFSTRLLVGDLHARCSQHRANPTCLSVSRAVRRRGHWVMRTTAGDNDGGVIGADGIRALKRVKRVP